ncbi:hypothetical protein P7K49_003429 [Saguinus oedipus]|uniref:Integrator complex subunit 1 R3 domain-containing protein n=1 Tax=Saguinus oedipus TaxID=9490 RepID=A0ABQ9W702_SAGOE|nr:hypothetical protein P7K49_003429 [Saguinus oedipus]
MIAALLHGRTHLNFQEFRQQNHLSCFLHVLGLLELLQPHVFRSEHQGALWDCLLSFIRLLLVRAPAVCPHAPFYSLGPGLGPHHLPGTGKNPVARAQARLPALGTSSHTGKPLPTACHVPGGPTCWRNLAQTLHAAFCMSLVPPQAPHLSGHVPQTAVSTP